MIKKCVIIVGLPGSGKTTLGEQLARQLNAQLIDDPRGKKEIVEKASSETVIITSPLFCRQSAQEKLQSDLKDMGVNDIEWIFFDNDPRQCKINASRREDKEVNGSIHYLSKVYHIPVGTVTRSVFKD